LACRGPSDVDKGITHWSASELRDAFVDYPGGADVSARTIGRALAEANLKPHRQRYFLTSRDPLFKEKRRDIVSLYLRPPPGATVLCLDEKPSIQALGRKHPDLPMKPGYPVYREFEYVRHGVLHLFAAFNIKTGRVLGQVQEKKTRVEFIELLDLCAWHYKRGDVHIVLDNASYHFTDEVKAWLKVHPRFKFHFTPTHASWLNQVECWFSLIARKAIRRGTFHSKLDLHSELMAYVSHWNGQAHPFNWAYGEKLLEAPAVHATHAA
jgi:transposase